MQIILQDSLMDTPRVWTVLRPLGQTESIMGTVLYLLRLLVYSREGLDNSTGTIGMYVFCDYFVLKL